MLRIGQGFDVHRICAGRRLMLGGVQIPWDRGLLGHSDADVLLHAVTDAILGAVAAGDIGHWFPPDDRRYADADSAELLQAVMTSVPLRDWAVVNLDATVMAEAPKVAPHVAAIRASLATLLGVDVACVSVKATTTEGLGFTGRAEGIAAMAIVLLTGSGARV